MEQYGTIQYLRNDIIDQKIKDYVKTARAKGVPEGKVYTRHILRNSLLPIAAFLGYEITRPYQWFGLHRIDFQLSRPRTTFHSINCNCVILQSLQHSYMISGAAVIVGTMLSDIILSIVDPRIRIE